MAVHVTLSPPDGFEAWAQAEWDAWLAAHPWEPAEKLGDRSDWLVFLYQSRTHAKKSEGDLAPFMERLITEKPIASHEIARLLDDRAGLQALSQGAAAYVRTCHDIAQAAALLGSRLMPMVQP